MFTIEKEKINEIVIKNSKFIGLIYNVSSETEVKSILDEVKKGYKDSTHICYAYRLDNKEKLFDDGEPTGTAGAPIMEVIKKNELINTLIIVVRYFGGIKLGAGGLIRAYSKCAREVLSLCDKELYIKYNYYKLSTNYDNLKLLNTLINGLDLDIESKKFDEMITYIIKVKDNDDNLFEQIKNTSIKIEKI